MQELVPSSPTRPDGNDPLPQGGRLRWVNDRSERYEKLVAKGYLIVEKDGKPVSRLSGEPTRFQYLMQAPPMLAYGAPEPMEAVTYNDIIDVVAEEIIPPVRIDVKLHVLESDRTIEHRPTCRQRFIKWVDKKKHNPRVRERLLRLNPDITEGQRIRGWHPAPTLDGLWMKRNVMGKREFIKKHGREALKAMPKHCFWRQGRRSYIIFEAVQDQAWKRS